MVYTKNVYVYIFGDSCILFIQKIGYNIFKNKVKTGVKMRFEMWLVKQKNKDTMVGDLARDFIRTGCYDISEGFACYPPCSEAIEALEEALVKYKRYMKGKADQRGFEYIRIAINEAQSV